MRVLCFEVWPWPTSRTNAPMLYILYTVLGCKLVSVRSFSPETTGPSSALTRARPQEAAGTRGQSQPQGWSRRNITCRTQVERCSQRNITAVEFTAPKLKTEMKYVGPQLNGVGGDEVCSEAKGGEPSAPSLMDPRKTTSEGTLERTTQEVSAHSE